MPTGRIQQVDLSRIWGYSDYKMQPLGMMFYRFATGTPPARMILVDPPALSDRTESRVGLRRRNRWGSKAPSPCICIR